MAEESFDNRVERFLKGLMSSEEESKFKQELYSDKDKLIRAQTIAMAIKEMRNKAKASDEKIVAEVQEMSDSDLDRIATGAATEDFDNRVERYLKGLMSQDEETDFRNVLATSEELRERAQVIAMAVQAMSHEARHRDQLLVEAIRDSKMSDLKRLIGIRVVNWFKYVSIAASVLVVLGVGATLQIRQGQIYDLNSAVYNYNQAVGGMSRGVIPRSSVDSLLVELEKGGTEETVRRLIVEKENYDGEPAVIDWWIANYYINQKDYKEAETYLNRIIKEDEDTPLAVKAKDVLQRIDKIWFK